MVLETERGGTSLHSTGNSLLVVSQDRLRDDDNVIGFAKFKCIVTVRRNC